MKSAMAAIVALTLFDVAAGQAADIAPPQPSWSGFYAGVSAGGSEVGGALRNYDFGKVNGSDRGAVAGAFGGYNFSLGANLLAGVEASVNAGARSRRAASTQSFDGFTIVTGAQASHNWEGMVRARFGALVTPNTLLYATGGLAIINETVTSGATSVFNPGADWSERYRDMRFGWAVGGGVEHRLNGSWNARLDYVYSDYGSQTYGVAERAVHVKTHAHTLALGLSYGF